MATVSPEIDRPPLGLMTISAAFEAANPILIKNAVSKDVDRRTVVLVNEFLKLVLSILMGPSGAGLKVLTNWKAVAMRAGPPAVLAILQNNLLQIAYPRLDPLHSSVFGQTKIFFVALAARVVLGRRMSVQQAFALCMLVGGSWLMVLPPSAFQSLMAKAKREDQLQGPESTEKCEAENGESTTNGGSSSSSNGAVAVREERHPEWKKGLAAQFCANVVSGLNFAVLELGLQGRHPLTFNVEMAICGMISSSLAILGWRSENKDIFNGWTSLTPAVTVVMAASGIIAGFVVKRGGGIAKALSSVEALIMVALIKVVTERQPLSIRQGLIALPMVTSGMVIYNRYPAPRK